MSVIELRAGGRRYLVGPRSEFPVSDHGSTLQRMISHIGRDDFAKLQALRARLGRGSKSGECAAWLTAEVASGRMSILPVHELSVVSKGANSASQRNRGIELTVGDGGAPRPGDPNISAWPPTTKIMEMILRSIHFMPAETRKTFLTFVSPQALKMLALTLVVWAGLHAVGVGEGIDVFLLGVGYALIGWSAFDAVKAIGKAIALALKASTTQDLDTAAQSFAQGLTMLGINALLILITHRAGNKPAGAAEAETLVLARWRSYIDGLQLRFDGSRAALWARLGDKGERAAALASAEGRTTLEGVLKDTGFFERYMAEFGDAQTASTKSIWQMISEKFASQLRGSVTVYTDQLKLGEGETQLSAELLEILDRPGVTGVVIKDVTNPSLSQVWTHADIAKARGVAPRSGLWN